MEVNNHMAQLARNDLSRPGGLLNQNDLQNELQTELKLQNDLIGLKQQHQLQQELLNRQWQQEQLRLTHAQEKQLQMQMLAQQKEIFEKKKALEEQQRQEQEMQEKQRLLQIRHKTKEKESAVASSAVKAKLQEFVLNKKHREAHGSLGNSPPHFHHWSAQQRSFEQHSPPTAGLSPPYRPHHLLGQYDDDFPLRKTVSDSNLKVRSKIRDKVQQRSSPLQRRKDLTKRKQPLSVDTTLSSSSPDSGPNTPPSGHIVGPEPHLLQGKEDGVAPFPLQMMSNMVINQSMPNISIGLPRNSPTSTQDPAHNSPGGGLTPEEVMSRAVAAAAAAQGAPMSIMGNAGPPQPAHLPPHPMAFYPAGLPILESSEFSPGAPTSPAYITAQMQSLEQARGSTGKLVSSMSVPTAPYMVPVSAAGGAITDSQAAQARLHRSMRPLSRTHSAPLPLGHPLLNQAGLLLHQDQRLKAQDTKLYLKQRLQERQGSKNLMEDVDEEAEARLAQEMIREREEEEVIVIGDAPGRGLSVDSALEGVRQSTSAAPMPQTHSLDDSASRSRQAFLASRHELVRQKAVSHDSPPSQLLTAGGSSRISPTRPGPLKSPDITAANNASQAGQDIIMKRTFTTGLAYDSTMLKHSCICGNNASHPEHAGRLQSIWSRLQESGLAAQCERIKVRKAQIDEIQLCHGQPYTLIFGTNAHNRHKLEASIKDTLPSRFCQLACGGIGVDPDTVWSDLHTPQAARMATGCVIELALKVASGELKNGMAVVRPPGHHAEPNLAMGFCYFNNIAIAARVLQERMKLQRILIVDWDVHHGNSTQQIFYDDPRVLYISIHRHDKGNFFPGTGAPEDCGIGAGTGFNVNIGFFGALNPPMNDAEYLAAFRSIIIPIAREFNPEIVLVSSGFDGAQGHPAPLGGYNLSSELFGHLAGQLMMLAQGKVVLALEGGYDLPVICDCSEACVQALLGEPVEPIREEELIRRPCDVAIEAMHTTIKCHSAHWPVLTKYMPLVGCSAVDAKIEREEADTVSAFASLSVVQECPNSPIVVAPIESGVDPSAEPMEES